MAVLSITGFPYLISNAHLFYYHWIHTAAGGLCVTYGIIHLVVSVLTLGWFIRCKMKNKKYHTVGTVPKYHTVGTVPKYHTVGTVPKYHTVGTVPKYPTVGTVPKYHTVGTVPKSNIKIVERGKIDTPRTQIICQVLGRSFSWLFTGTSIESGWVLWAQTSPLGEIIRSC